MVAHESESREDGGGQRREGCRQRGGLDAAVGQGGDGVGSPLAPGGRRVARARRGRGLAREGAESDGAYGAGGRHRRVLHRVW